MIDRTLAAVAIAGAALVVILLFAGPALIGAKKASAVKSPAGTSAPSGAQVFSAAGCAGCHTLSAAGSTGSIGPDLDQVKPDAATVAATVRSGAGAMPAFSGKLSDAEIAAVASYVSSVAGR